MTELRTDPITGIQVLVVPGRSARPNEHVATAPSVASSSDCPFCEGNERRTPPELSVSAPAGRKPNAPGWLVRAIPNRFPTVTAGERPTGTPPISAASAGRDAYGFHEVVIESPSHSPLLPFMAPEQVGRVLEVCRSRVAELGSRPAISAVMLFENTGPESGGSLWHPHAQLVATAAVPPALDREMVGADSYRARTGATCAFESVRDDELRTATRTVLESETFAAYAPFASAYPYEMRLVPKRHAPSFGDASDAELSRLSDDLPRLLRALLNVVPGASYNLVVSSPGAGLAHRATYHWHLDIAPRLLRPDAFDLGSGFHVNTVPPEEAARALRAALGAKP